MLYLTETHNRPHALREWFHAVVWAGLKVILYSKEAIVPSRGVSDIGYP